MAQIDGKSQGAEPAASLLRRQKVYLDGATKSCNIGHASWSFTGPQLGGILSWFRGEAPTQAFLRGTPLTPPLTSRAPFWEVFHSPALVPTRPEPLRELAPWVIHC